MSNQKEVEAALENSKEGHRLWDDQGNSMDWSDRNTLAKEVRRQRKRIVELEKSLKAQGEDSKRLDWLFEGSSVVACYTERGFKHKGDFDNRKAIDKARALNAGKSEGGDE